MNKNVTILTALLLWFTVLIFSGTKVNAADYPMLYTTADTVVYSDTNGTVALTKEQVIDGIGIVITGAEGVYFKVDLGTGATYYIYGLDLVATPGETSQKASTPVQTTPKSYGPAKHIYRDDMPANIEYAVSLLANPKTYEVALGPDETLDIDYATLLYNTIIENETAIVKYIDSVDTHHDWGWHSISLKNNASLITYFADDGQHMRYLYYSWTDSYDPNRLIQDEQSLQIGFENRYYDNPHPERFSIDYYRLGAGTKGRLFEDKKDGNVSFLWNY